MIFGFQTALIIFEIIWLVILSYLVWRIYSHFNTIFKDSRDQTVASVLEKLVKEHDLTKKEIVSLQDRIGLLEEKSFINIQKTGLIHFNPFQDTGGEQSFILALLNAHDSGVVISGLYARSGMRWYVKEVTHGKGKDHELSEEEKKVVSLAK
jgi:hypothetical protein